MVLYWQKGVVCKSYAMNHYKSEEQLFDEYKKQSNFLYSNPDCAEKEKVYYDPSAGLEFNEEFKK